MKSASTPKSHRDGGFALVVVIWGVGLIALLLLASIAAARWRLMASANSAASVQAGQLAEAAVRIAGSRLASGTAASAGSAVDGTPTYCALPGGARAAISVEDEGGKVDLNGAPLKLLEALFIGLGVDAGASADIARAIADYRTASPIAAVTLPGPGPSLAPKHALFQTVFELDQVAVIPPALARELAPFVTTSSARAGLDPALAPPALFAALSGAALSDVQALAAAPYPNRLDRTDARFPLAFIQASPGGVYLVHAEAMMASGAVAVREQLSDVRQVLRGGPKVLERRAGRSRYVDHLRELLATDAPAVPGC